MKEMEAEKGVKTFTKADGIQKKFEEAIFESRRKRDADWEVQLELVRSRIPTLSDGDYFALEEVTASRCREMIGTLSRSKENISIDNGEVALPVVHTALFVRALENSKIKEFNFHPEKLTKEKIRMGIRYVRAQLEFRPSGTLSHLYYNALNKVIRAE